MHKFVHEGLSKTFGQFSSFFYHSTKTWPAWIGGFLVHLKTIRWVKG